VKYLLDRVLGLAVLLAMSVAGAVTFLRHEVLYAWGLVWVSAAALALLFGAGLGMSLLFHDAWRTSA